MINKLPTIVSLCVLTLFSAVALSQEVEDDGAGLPPLGAEGDVASLGSDDLQPPRDGEVFGHEIPELLVEPELEEGEVVERGAPTRAINRYAAYSSNRLSVNAMRVPVRAKPSCHDRILNRSIRAYPLARKTNGDDEMDGDVYVLIEGEMVHTNGRVLVRGRVEMSDKRYSGGSKFRHTFDESIFSVSREAPGCRITGVSFSNYAHNWSSADTGESGESTPMSGGRIFAKSPAGNQAFRTYFPPTGGFGPGKDSRQLFASASCRTDAQGNDVGRIGCNKIAVRRLRVHLAPMENGKACQPFHIPLPGAALSTSHGQATAKTSARDLFPIRRIRGDANVKGKVSGFALAKIAWDANRVRLYNRVRMSETGGDRTIYDSAATSNLVDVALDAPGCKITGVSGAPLNGRVDFERKSQQWTHFGGSGELDGLLKRVWCRTNAGSNDDQRIGCIAFNYGRQYLYVTFQ